MCCILRPGHLGFLAAEVNAVVLSHVAPLYHLPELLFAHVTGAPPGGGALSKKHPRWPEGTKTRRGGSKTEIGLGGVQARG